MSGWFGGLLGGKGIDWDVAGPGLTALGAGLVQAGAGGPIGNTNRADGLAAGILGMGNAMRNARQDRRRQQQEDEANAANGRFYEAFAPDKMGPDGQPMARAPEAMALRQAVPESMRSLLATIGPQQGMQALPGLLQQAEADRAFQGLLSGRGGAPVAMPQAGVPAPAAPGPRAAATPQGDDLDAIVRTVYGEAAGEPPEGQRAVAAVIRNRAAATGQPVSAVVRAPNQFEPWNNPQTRARLEALRPDSPEYQAILRNISGDGPDPTNGATHFFSPTAQTALGRQPPAWATGEPVVIGRHNFYRPPGGVPGAPRQVAAAPAGPATEAVPGSGPAMPPGAATPVQNALPVPGAPGGGRAPMADPGAPLVAQAQQLRQRALQFAMSSDPRAQAMARSFDSQAAALEARAVQMQTRADNPPPTILMGEGPQGPAGHYERLRDGSMRWIGPPGPASSVVNVDQRGQSAEAQAVGTSLGQERQRVRTAAETAAATIDQIRNVRAIGAPTDRLAQAREVVGGIMDAMGINSRLARDATSLQAFNSVASRALLSAQLEQNGVQTASDARVIQQTFSAATNTMDANEMIMRGAEAQAQRNIDRAEFYQSHIERTGSAAGASEAWNRFIRQTPMVARAPQGGMIFLNEWLPVAEAQLPGGREEAMTLWRENAGQMRPSAGLNPGTVDTARGQVGGPVGRTSDATGSYETFRRLSQEALARPVSDNGAPPPAAPSRPRATNAQGQVLEFDGQAWVPVR